MSYNTLLIQCHIPVLAPDLERVVETPTGCRCDLVAVNLEDVAEREGRFSGFLPVIETAVLEH